jgi:hypothetical protein
MMTAMPRYRADRVRVLPARHRGGAPSGVHTRGGVIAGIIGSVQALHRTRLGEHRSPDVPWQSARGRVHIAESLHKWLGMPRTTRRASEPENGEKGRMQAPTGFAQEMRLVNAGMPPPNWEGLDAGWELRSREKPPRWDLRRGG